MNYIGSKLRLSEWIFTTVQQTVQQPLRELIFADIFAGTGIVGRTFKPFVKQVIANDIEAYSYCLLKNYIQNTETIPQKRMLLLLDELQSQPTKAGFIFENYAEHGKANRLYFSEENGKRIDTYRTTLEKWKQNAFIAENEYYFLLATLLESADAVANTASVYGAYLKQLKKSAQKPLELKPALFAATPSHIHRVFQENANTLIRTIKGNILYLDPPYNARQYGANYHILNTIALYDTFEPKGKTGLRNYERSVYCQKNDVQIAFEDLICHANFDYIFLSYNNEGLMSLEEIESVMSRYGTYQVETTNYQRFKADKDQNRIHKANSTIEYLHILHKK